VHETAGLCLFYDLGMIMQKCAYPLYNGTLRTGDDEDGKYNITVMNSASKSAYYCFKFIILFGGYVINTSVTFI